MLTKVRPGTADDEPFIYNSWLKANEKSPSAHYMLREIYYSNHKKIVANILKGAKVAVICNTDDDSQIYGYMVFTVISGNVFLHFIYVKQVYRRLGMARHLMKLLVTEGLIADEKTAIFVTHASRFFPFLRKGWNLIYNPYLLERIAA